MQQYGSNVEAAVACRKAVFPQYIRSADLTYPKGDATLQAVHTIAAGSSAGFGGQVVKLGKCVRMKVEIDYIGGQDCDSCNDVDTLSIATETRYIDKTNTTLVLANAYWAAIRVQAVDATGAAVAAAQDATVFVEAEWVKECPDCPDVLVP